MQNSFCRVNQSNMKRKRLFVNLVAVAVLHSFLLPNFIAAQTAVPAETSAAIRKEGRENSKIMNTLHYFTDLYGPRLTGSPNHVAAANWAVKEMTAWGVFERRVGAVGFWLSGMGQRARSWPNDIAGSGHSYF